MGTEELFDVLDVGEGGFFGFVGDGEFGEEAIGGEVGGLAFFDEVIIETDIVVIDGVFDDGVVGLVGLDEGIGFCYVAATDATEDLG